MQTFLRIKLIGLFIIITLLPSAQTIGQDKNKENNYPIKSELINGLKFRSIGPAFTSGRIADFAVNTKNPSEFYIGVASGNIWKTTNNGTTFEPVFDKYGAYSIGCLAIDPNNPNVVWAGTGENNHQRALGYGDGVYLTLDGGKTWKNMGLKESRQIGMILIDPRNSNTVYVAAEGSVWGPGGDRGLYKTTDRGKTWKKVLEISENTGINNIICDPRNPDILYATAEQRRRHVHTKIGGGPESAIYKSEDAGVNWRKLDSGLPKEHMGGIGIAISPQNPDVVYAIIEAANKSGGFFRSADRGESWTKMSSHHASGQYYNEIYCDPVEFDKIYSVETFSHFTEDGGKTWEKLSTKDRHVDDHALWINPKDNKHFMIGGDGGVYITYDAGNNWRQISNLPVTQFYRVSVDNEWPFYNVYGGTQDNATLGGPSRNISSFGVTSGEWYVTVFGDGFWSASDPNDPNIVYSEWQYGNVVRYDKKSGEKIMIKPQPRKEELTYRWNWNAPLIISPHSSSRLYIAANKLFRSNDRGNTWDVISDDLTAQIDRNTWPVMGKYWSSDAVVKDVSSSQYGTIVSLDESPVKEDLIYVGTDDGLIQITENSGVNWRKVSSFRGIPENTYVSDLLADRFDENTVYATFDNSKRDDFKPYILKSTNQGKSWKAISKGLPENGTVHTISQDHINKNLLFAGTEFGIFFTIDGGDNWVQLKSGVPTIAIRDIAIQERESDLVLASFGRGFYILDDYSPLRKLSEKTFSTSGQLYPVRDAYVYIPTDKIYGQGATYFGAENPEYGATFTYFMKEVPKTQKQIRSEKEKKLFENGDPIPQLTFREQELEKQEIPPYLLVSINDMDGSTIRTFTKKASKGLNRITWDLKHNKINAIQSGEKFDPYKKESGSIYVLPGTYSVDVALVHNNKTIAIGESQNFEVKSLNNTTLPAGNNDERLAFLKDVNDLSKNMVGAIAITETMMKELRSIKQTVLTMPDTHENFIPKLNDLEKELDEILFAFKGAKAKASWEEIPPAQMPLYNRLNSIIWSQINSTSAITQTSKTSLEILKEDYPPVLSKIQLISTKTLPEIRKTLDNMNAPYTPGRIPKWE